MRHSAPKSRKEVERRLRREQKARERRERRRGEGKVPELDLTRGDTEARA